MKRVLIFTLLAGAFSATMGEEEEATNPLDAVLELVGQLTAQIDADRDAQNKVYHEYSQWCEETAKNAEYSKKTATKQKAKLEAKIAELGSDIEVADSKIEGLVAAISKADSELKQATTVREKEQVDFVASEKELMEAIDTLGRAVGVLEKEVASNPSAFVQVATTDVAGMLQGLSAVLDAAGLPSDDKKKLLSYIQSQQGSDDEDDEELGAPAGASYKSKGGNIVEVVQDMKEKADEQLGQLRSAEVKAKQDYEMLKGALSQKSAADTKDMKDEKSEKSAAAEGKASAEGDLEVTTKELKSSTEGLADTQASCLKMAADRENTLASQQEELQVLANAKKLLVESMKGAASFLQVSASSKAQIQGSKVVSAVKRLARQQHSAGLAQLASRISTLMRSSRTGSPFMKIRGLITDMIAKLEKQAGQETQEKAYCDEQLAKTEAKTSDLGDDIEKMTSRFDQAAAKSAESTQQVMELENELSALAKEQAELDKTRQESKSEFLTVKADDEKALNGVRKALGVLRDYYGSSAAAMIQDETQFSAFMQQPSKPETFEKSTGAGGSIIGILEVCESDIATSLAKATAEEDDAQAEYEKLTQESKVAKAAAEQGVKYKTQEIKSLKATLAEISTDRETANTEFAAVQEYYSTLKDRCIAKPETYEKLTARRAAEIQGLKEALGILEDETALVQRKRRSSFRGALAAR